MINLDTHIFLFALAGALRRREKKLLENNHWGISAIVLWEISKLNKLGRIALEFNSPEFKSALQLVHIWSIDAAVAQASNVLDFDSDPADELIAATSIHHQVPLLTRDRRITTSKLVPLA